MILTALNKKSAMREDDRVRWTKLVADFESEDLSQREFAQERGISLSNLRYWIYRLRKEAAGGLVEVGLPDLIAKLVQSLDLGFGFTDHRGAAKNVGG